MTTELPFMRFWCAVNEERVLLKRPGLTLGEAFDAWAIVTGVAKDQADLDNLRERAEERFLKIRRNMTNQQG